MRAKRGGAAAGPSPVDRRKTGSKHQLIYDGKSTTVHVITTEHPIPRPRRRHPARRRTTRPALAAAECLLGDKAYDSKAVRGELRRRCIQAVIWQELPRPSRAWASSATSSSRPSPPAPPAQTQRSAWNDVSNSTTLLMPVYSTNRMPDSTSRSSRRLRPGDRCGAAPPAATARSAYIRLTIWQGFGDNDPGRWMLRESNM